jgi:hypothetical protein
VSNKLLGLRSEAEAIATSNHFLRQTDFSSAESYAAMFTANDGELTSAPVSVDITINDVNTNVGLTDKNWEKE